MRFRFLLVASAFVVFARLGAGCHYDVDPGGYCQSGWFADYSCPPGYSCNDMESWTCTPDTHYPDSYYPATTTAEDAGLDARRHVADAGTREEADAALDASAPPDGEEDADAS